MKVTTTKGTEYTGPRPGSASDDYEPLTEAEAKSLCAEANRRAEALGIKTRYEVRSE